MNIEASKSIDIVGYLQKMGLSGIDKGRYHWFCSPFRDEKTPSFSVDTKNNHWIDFGTGEKGDLIDLVKLLFGIDTHSALEKLSENRMDQYISFSKAKKDNVIQEPAIKINQVKAISNPALIHYITKRGINIKLASLYCKEIQYTIKDKIYYAIGFKNDAEGWELRNKYFKGHNINGITTIKSNASIELNITEGFIDFLSAMEHYKIQRPNHSTIILNSLCNLDKIIPFFARYTKINLFLDNDPVSKAGQNAAEKISRLHPNVINHAAKIYSGYNDFNDFILNKKQ